MAESKLDQIVKGVPPPNVSPTQVAQAAKSTAPPSTSTSPVPPSQTQQSSNNNTNNTNNNVNTTAPTLSDPRDTLPDSDAQKYLNLLILESSLRAQYVSLRARQQIYDLVLCLLIAWTLTFTYLLFFRPREDGSGVGGSVYWVLETGEKLFWCSGIVTLVLFWATGTYERGVRWPRKFVGTANRGLRGFNMKIVVVRAGNIWAEMLAWPLALLDPFGWMREKRVNFQVVPRDIEAGANKEHWNHHAARHGLVEEDVAPGGDVIKLLILPKPFSPDFREGWENYRMEYWEKENARRSELRKVVKARIREVARREGGWLWWTGWRGWNNVRILGGKSRRQVEMEKLALREMKEKRRRESVLRSGADGSLSRSSSRSSSLAPDADARHPRRAGEERVRRGSSSARRPKKVGAPAGSRLSATETLLEDSGDQALQPLSKRGTGSLLGADGVKSEESRASTPEIKEEPAEA